MSDDFIPLNQSTPVQRQWNQGRNQNLSSSGGFRDNHFQNGKRGRRAMRQGNKWGNNIRNSSFSSDNNSYSNNSYDNNRVNIDAYLHPSMLQDPWAELRQKKN